MKLMNFTVTQEVCSLDKDPGPCPGSLLRWYYDEKRRACRQFVYGGCKGNGNKFRTRADCEQRCPIRGIQQQSKSYNLRCLEIYTLIYTSSAFINIYAGDGKLCAVPLVRLDFIYLFFIFVN